jgi:F0F1-type ATP synthase assembly protein I
MKNEAWAIALRVAVSISSWIAFPVIFGLFLGKWLDKKFGTDPWLFLTTIGLCFLVSMYGLVTEAKKEFKKIEKEYQDNKKEQNNLNKK